MMMSIPPAVIACPATTNSKTDSARSAWSGTGPFPFFRATRTPAIGPRNGIELTLECGRGAIESHHVVGVLAVHGEAGHDDMGLAPVAVGERGTKGTVDETTGQGGLLAGTALTTEERAGDLAHGVHPLLEVHGEWEEVDAFA